MSNVNHVITGNPYLDDLVGEIARQAQYAASRLERTPPDHEVAGDADRLREQVRLLRDIRATVVAEVEVNVEYSPTHDEQLYGLVCAIVEAAAQVVDLEGEIIHNAQGEILFVNSN